MPYDLFISYCRRDNASGRITELKQRIEADYRAFAKEELRCFFDLEDIHGMDDWRSGIPWGLPFRRGGGMRNHAAFQNSGDLPIST